MSYAQNREKIYAAIYKRLGHPEDYTKYNLIVEYVLKVAEICYREGIKAGEHNMQFWEDNMSEYEIIDKLKQLGVIDGDSTAT